IAGVAGSGGDVGAGTVAALPGLGLAFGVPERCEAAAFRRGQRKSGRGTLPGPIPVSQRQDRVQERPLSPEMVLKPYCVISPASAPPQSGLAVEASSPSSKPTARFAWSYAGVRLSSTWY